MGKGHPLRATGQYTVPSGAALRGEREILHDRLSDQTEIALSWYERSPLKWSRIARTVSIKKGLNLWENARLFGLLNMALADGYIAMVATKNHYNYWRPPAQQRMGGLQQTPIRRTQGS